MELGELESAAAAVLSAATFDYIAGGSDDERTLEDNERAWAALRLRPRVLRDVSAISTSTTVLGRELALPIIAAPTAMSTMAHRDGEPAVARATRDAGSIYVVSMMATTAIEEIVAASHGGRIWMHVTALSDRGNTRALCERAKEAGCEAIVLTVDCPVAGQRPRSLRNPFSLPPGAGLPNVAPGEGAEGLMALVAGFDRTISFDDLEQIAGWSGGLPVVVKGVLRGDDAVRCLDAGASAIAVSNHGGRQLDQCIATADALPDVLDAVQDRAEVYVDGGIRRGTQVLAALAMGARAVLLGRPLVYGLAIDGEKGVAAVWEAFRGELERAMALCGSPAIADLTPDLLVRR